MKSIHIMLDLETLSTAPDAAIVSIGACVIGKRGKSNEFYRAISLKESEPNRLGRLDKDTVQWWISKPQDAQSVFTDPDAMHISSALCDFTHWVVHTRDKQKIDSMRNVYLWGNSAAFDNVILRNANARQPTAFIGELLPAHWNDRCYRTVSALAPSIKRKQTGTHHNALDDAKSQAKHLIRVLRHLGKTIEDIA